MSFSCKPLSQNCPWTLKISWVQGGGWPESSCKGSWAETQSITLQLSPRPHGGAVEVGPAQPDWAVRAWLRPQGSSREYKPPPKFCSPPKVFYIWAPKLQLLKIHSLISHRKALSRMPASPSPALTPSSSQIEIWHPPFLHSPSEGVEQIFL